MLQIFLQVLLVFLLNFADVVIDHSSYPGLGNLSDDESALYGLNTACEPCVNIVSELSQSCGIPSSRCSRYF